MPMHIEPAAMSHAAREPNTFLRTNFSDGFCAASATVSSAVWNA